MINNDRVYSIHVSVNGGGSLVFTKSVPSGTVAACIDAIDAGKVVMLYVDYVDTGAVGAFSLNSYAKMGGNTTVQGSAARAADVTFYPSINRTGTNESIVVSA